MNTEMEATTPQIKQNILDFKKQKTKNKKQNKNWIFNILFLC
jgi:hypothetical protein